MTYRSNLGGGGDRAVRKLSVAALVVGLGLTVAVMAINVIVQGVAAYMAFPPTLHITG